MISISLRSGRLPDHQSRPGGGLRIDAGGNESGCVVRARSRTILVPQCPLLTMDACRSVIWWRRDEWRRVRPVGDIR